MILPLPDGEAEFGQESLLFETHNGSVVADSTLIANDLNNSTLRDDGFKDQSHQNILVNPTSEGVDEITTLPTTATSTILTKRFSNPTGEVIDNNAVRNQGLSMKSIFSVSLDFVSQARMRNSTFKFVPPANCNVENSETHGITTTNCLTKCVYMILHFKVDLFCFNGKCVTHNITTKGPHCKFSPLAPNTLSSELSQTKPPWGSLLSMGCTMAVTDIVVPSSLLATSILKLVVNELLTFDEGELMQTGASCNG
ncbi:hypothetical protein TSUD_274670 [Trifolium subterraneum]|uniref:Uncharacterized protein n=1 Tax=Trifolium subterraneum TaxID=3900 RepID=A0A2Z6NXF4_TRISU|nr:hypothetical protein TSUD_274670 [Trifolium subterraneum]